MYNNIKLSEKYWLKYFSLRILETFFFDIYKVFQKYFPDNKNKNDHLLNYILIYSNTQKKKICCPLLIIVPGKKGMSQFKHNAPKNIIFQEIIIYNTPDPV